MSGGLHLAELAIGYRRRRRATTVAAGLSATAARGELTVLLGRNGAGKSTLIRTLCGLQPALAGRVLLDGADLAALPAGERARRVAVVLTERVEAGLLSARELVGLGRSPHLGFHGRLGAADRVIVGEALHAVGAAVLADRPVAELSDGQRQRVLTARALAQRPRLLVLDEPTAFLDVAGRAALFALLGELARDRDMAVLVSTHDLELALGAADRIWLLDQAGVLRHGSAAALECDGALATLYDADTPRPVGAAATAAGTPPVVAPVPAARVRTVLAALAEVSPYFAVETGAPDGGGWRPLSEFYAAPDLVAAAVSEVGQVIGAPTRLVAASTFQLGLAARLWSIGLGALAGFGLLIELDPDRLRYRHEAGRLRLRLEQPSAVPAPDPAAGTDPAAALAEAVLTRHLAPLADALRAAGPIAPQLLRGNAASAALGAGRAFDRYHRHPVPGPGWRLARRLLADERLAGALVFDDGGTDYRRRSCCLFYRTPGGGLCIDCALDAKPACRNTSKEKGKENR